MVVIDPLPNLVTCARQMNVTPLVSARIFPILSLRRELPPPDRDRRAEALRARNR